VVVVAVVVVVVVVVAAAAVATVMKTEFGIKSHADNKLSKISLRV
jgi:hypothetical protein